MRVENSRHRQTPLKKFSITNITHSFRALFWLITSCFSLAFSGPNANAKISIDLFPEVTGTTTNAILSKESNPFWIAIQIEEAIKLDSYSFEVTFDTTLLKFIEAKAAVPPAFTPNFLESRGGLPLGFIGKISLRNANQVSIAHALIGSDSTKSPSGGGNLAFLKFQPLNKTGIAEFKIAQSKVLDWQQTLDTTLTLSAASLTFTTVTALIERRERNGMKWNANRLAVLIQNRNVLGRISLSP